MRFAAPVAFVFLALACHGRPARAQGSLQRYEIGVQFSSLSLDGNDRRDASGGTLEFNNLTLPGAGGRFTYNVNEHLGLEAEVNSFFRETRRFAPAGTGGRPTQAAFGIKAGRRFEKVGVFAKARPGFISFGEGRIPLSSFLDPNPPITGLRAERVTHVALDLGGVLEFYPSRRLLTRFDAGDTIIRYGDQVVAAPGVFPIGTVPATITVPGKIRHNVQFSAGVGFRF